MGNEKDNTTNIFNDVSYVKNDHYVKFKLNKQLWWHKYLTNCKYVLLYSKVSDKRTDSRLKVKRFKSCETLKGAYSSFKDTSNMFTQ